MAIFHLHAATGTRAGGQSAAAKNDYIARLGDYINQLDKLVHSASGNMPAWAVARPKIYWEAADSHERENGRLFKEIEAALPVELNEEQHLRLVENFSRCVTCVVGGNLPFTFALHEGKPKNSGDQSNPHFHLLISERLNDGHARSSEIWFKRVAVGKGKQAIDGGARKTDELKPKAWLESTRALWADMCNEALSAAGHKARIDHRSLADQGIQRDAAIHLGPTALAYERRTGQASRRRIDGEKLQAEERAFVDARKREAKKLHAEAEDEHSRALVLNQKANDKELELHQSVAAVKDLKLTLSGFDLSEPLACPNMRSTSRPYVAKALLSGIILHLKMPDDRVAFVEHKLRIRMSVSDALNADSVAHALEVGCAKWGRITVTGGSKFQRLVIEQATHLGLIGRIDGLDAENRINPAEKWANRSR